MSKPKTKKSVKPKKVEVVDWVPPYPSEGLVRVQVNQDISVSGRRYPVGVHVMEAELAHGHSHALSTPPPLTEE